MPAAVRRLGLYVGISYSAGLCRRADRQDRGWVNRDNEDDHLARAVQESCGQGAMTPFRKDCLAGKSILVTGGGGGLGREITAALAAHGAMVHICGRREGLLQEDRKSVV